MTAKTDYRPGEPVWFDLSTPDREATLDFYGALLGWTAEEPDDRFGGYASLLLHGHAVAGVMPLMTPEQPPAWTCYLCTADAEQTVALAAAAGGTVVTPPVQVGEFGTMAHVLDPVGAFVGLWQPGTHHGSELVDEPGAPVWAELTTRDLPTALTFYETVFGLAPHPSQDYVELQLAGTSVAGCMPTPEGVPDGTPAAWMPYFAPLDLDAACLRVPGLHGTLLVPQTAFPGGRFAMVQDPHGAVFGLLETTAAEAP